MELVAWHWWLISAAALFVLEIFTPALVAACLGIGCIGGAVAAWLSGSFELQLITFSLVSALSFWGVRPLIKRIAYPKKENFKTNVDALIGKEGRVLEEINNKESKGRALVEGDDWRAVSFDDDQIISQGAKVKVVRVDSTILVVKQIH